MAFEYVFHTDVKKQEGVLRVKAERKLTKLAQRYETITKADINLEQEVKGVTPYLYRASIVITTKPKKITAVKKNENAWLALKEALDAVERQITEVLDKIRRPWEKPKTLSTKEQ